MQQLLTKFPRLATSGRHNYTVITDRREFTTKYTFFTVKNQFQIITLGPGLYVPYKKGTYPYFWQGPMSDIAY